MSGEYVSTPLSDDIIEQRFDELVKKAGDLTGYDSNGEPLAQDELHQAGAIALQSRLNDPEAYPMISRVYHNILRAFPERGAHNLVQNGIRVANFYFIRRYGNDEEKLGNLKYPAAYDEFYDKIEMYTPEYVAQISDPAEIREACQILGDFDTFFDFNVQTSPAQRAVNVVGALGFLGMQEQEIDLADFACGPLQNLKMEALPAEIVDFWPVSIFERTDEGLLVPNEAAGIQFTEMVNNKLNIRQGIGIDIQDQTDQQRRRRLAEKRGDAAVPLMKATRNGRRPMYGIDLPDEDRMVSERYKKLVAWSSSNFYLTERLKLRELISKYLLINSYQPPNVSFFLGDMTNLDTDRFWNEHEDFRGDVGTYQTVFNQLLDRSQKAILEGRKILSPHAVEIYSDFMTMDPAGNVKPGSDFSTFTYRTYVRDGRQKDPVVEHFFTARTSRVFELVIEPPARKWAKAAGLALRHAA